MADCSNTEVFFAEWARMCEMSNEDCKCKFISRGITAGCPFCEDNVRKQIQEAIKIIQQWSDEHQRKTKQSEFLKLFPNARLDVKGIIAICPKIIDDTLVCNVASRDCLVCEKEYWLTEVE